MLPHDLEPWADTRSRELISDLSTVDKTTIGDVEELAPAVHRSEAERDRETPQNCPTEELLSAAGFALAEFCDLFAQNGLAPRGFGPDDSTPRRKQRRRQAQ